jgi:hypothetical protein
VASLVHEYLADVADYRGNGEMMSIREFRKKIKLRWILNLYAFAFLLVILGFILAWLQQGYDLLLISILMMFPILLTSLILSFLYMPNTNSLESKDTRYSLIIIGVVVSLISFLTASIFWSILLA